MLNFRVGFFRKRGSMACSTRRIVPSAGLTISLGSATVVRFGFLKNIMEATPKRTKIIAKRGRLKR